MYRASCNILYYNSVYHGTVVTNCQWFIVTTEALHYRTGQMTGMGFCSINLMYVISGIVKVLAVSVSLKRQIPTRPRLLCSSYPSGTAADRVGYFPQCQSVIPLRDPRGVYFKVGVPGKVLRYWLRKSVRSLKSSTRGIGCT